MPQVPFDRVLTSLGSMRAGALEEAAQFPGPSADPTTGDIFSAFFQEVNTTPAILRLIQGEQRPDPVFGYNPFRDDDLSGYEGERELFVGSRSPAETRVIKAQIDRERHRGQVIRNSGFTGIVAAISAGFTSPENLIPFGLIFRGVRTGATAGRIAAESAGSGFLASGVAEAILQRDQLTRTPEESVLNMTADAILSGVLGGASGLLSDARREAQRQVIAAQLTRGPVGDQIAGKLGTAEELAKLTPRQQTERVMAALREVDPAFDEVLAPGGWLSRKLVRGLRFNPGGRLMTTAESGEARLLGLQLVESPVLRRLTRQGGTLGATVETRVERWYLTGAVSRMRVGDEFSNYRKSGGRMLGDARRFREEVGKALSNEDQAVETIVEPAARDAIARAAAHVRAVLRPMQEQLIEAGLLSRRDLDLKGTAASYFHRVWNIDEVRVRRGELKDRLTLWIEQNGSLGPGETAAEVAEEAINSIEGSPSGTIPFALVREGSPLKQRVLLIPNSQIDDFLIHDVDTVLSRFLSTVAGELELSRLSPTFSARLASLEDELSSAAGRARAGDVQPLRDMAFVIDDQRAIGALDATFVDSRRALARELEGLTEQRPELFRAAQTARKRVRELEVRIRLLEGVRPSTAQRSELERLRGLLPGAKERLAQARGLLEALGERSAEIRRVAHGVDSTVRITTDVPLGAEPTKGELARAIETLEGRAAEVRRREARRGVSLEPQIGRIKSEFGAQIERLSREAQEATGLTRSRLRRQAAATAKRRDRAVQDVMLIRDRILNVAGVTSDPAHFAFRADRAMRRLNFLRFMGGVTISSIPDLGMPIFVNGLAPWYRSMRFVLRDPLHAFARAMDKEELVRMVAALETVGGALATRHQRLGDIWDNAQSVGRVERGLEVASHAFERLSGINYWNAYNKAFASMVASDRILRDSIAIAEGRAISRKSVENLAIAGIDRQRAVAIAEQFRIHGQVEDGLHFGRSQLWKGDVETQRAYQNAVISDVRRTIITPSAGELPTFMSIPIVRLLGQFRSFAFSATDKILVSGLQRADAAVVTGTMAAVTWGLMTGVLKAQIAGREFPWDKPQIALFEAVDRSGVLGMVTDVNNIVERVSRGQIGANPFLGADETASRYRGRNLFDAVAGPTVGTIEDLLQLPAPLFEAGGLTQTDVRRLRRLLPFQNLFYLRGILDRAFGTVDRPGFLTENLPESRAEAERMATIP